MFVLDVANLMNTSVVLEYDLYPLQSLQIVNTHIIVHHSVLAISNVNWNIKFK
jgi:hypothetical protein